MIEKGYISAILEGGKKVTVIPAFSSDVVSHELVVPFFLYKSLAVKMEIVYCWFQDDTGMVLGRMDGDWNHQIFDGVEIVTGDLAAPGVPSYVGHTHTCPDGSTSGPQ